MWCCFLVQIVPIFWKTTQWFYLQGNAIFLDVSTQMALWSFKTSGTTRPATQCHIPEHFNLQQHDSEDPKCHRECSSTWHSLDWCLHQHKRHQNNGRTHCSSFVKHIYWSTSSYWLTLTPIIATTSMPNYWNSFIMLTATICTVTSAVQHKPCRLRCGNAPEQVHSLMWIQTNKAASRWKSPGIDLHKGCTIFLQS